MGDRPSPESCASPDVAGERHQVDLTEPLADLSGLARDRVSAGPVSLDRAQQRRGDQHIPELQALAPAVIFQPARPREPAAAAGGLSAVQQDEHQPARAPDGTQRLTRVQELAMRTLPQLDALLVATRQLRRGKPLEIIGRERRLSIRGRQLGERTGPSAPAEQLPAAIECIRRRCGVSSDASSGTSASRGAPGRASVPARHERILRLVDQAYCPNCSLFRQIDTALARGAAGTLPLPACLRASRKPRIRRSGRREAPGSVRLVLARLVPVSSRRRVDPCMRFSRTRLTDVLHRRHSAWPASPGRGWV